MGKCQICGKTTKFNFPLCTDCNNKKEQGLIVQDQKGKWTIKEEPKEKKSSELTCIICGKPSNGKHFCFDCWNKYKDKSIDIRIKNCQETEVLDKYGNKVIRTDNGLYVRSKSEKIIYDYFYKNAIKVEYEKSIPYKNEKEEIKELHPDFFLPDYNLYIEYNGLTNKSYLKMKEYVNKIYKEKGLQVEIIEEKDINDFNSTIQKILLKYS